jgi:uncharacterized lipoprotein
VTGFKRLVVLLAAAQLGACAAVTCDEPQPYMNAKTNAAIAVPPDMNSPISGANAAIPQGPTGGDQLPSGRCLEQPPSFFEGTPTETVPPPTEKLEVGPVIEPSEDDETSD